jgi:hypothetical protein
MNKRNFTPSIKIPPMEPVPEDASKEERQAMYDEYCASVQRLNPRHFNANGTQKSTWDMIKDIFKKSS